ncbi:hypothetical protein T10_6778 [Trichinella papuae]|uniref:Transmembrane protein n=1 Tax=Trichinella papuae TaxID=268474 RepID=A0A0V1MCN8_9BILA|nr:hypothetical protein T10_6778 [Trichinella papuae]
MFVNEANSNAQIRAFAIIFPMTVVSLTVIVAIGAVSKQCKLFYCVSSFDDDNSLTAIKGKSYASFADWLPVDDSQKLRLEELDISWRKRVHRLCVMFIGSAFPIGTLAKSLGVA